MTFVCLLLVQQAKVTLADHYRSIPQMDLHRKKPG